jgi:hypothetical protein
LSTCAPMIAAGPHLVQVCAWCQSVIRTEPLEAGRKTELSHGMCPGCVEKQRAQLEQLKAVRAAMERKVCRCCGGYFDGLRSEHVCDGCLKEVAA